MLSVLLLSCVLLQVVSSQLSADGDTTADYDGDARYRCVLADATGVQQVTWQRLHQDKPLETLATYSKRFGSQINEPHRGKVLFTEASLSSTSITVKNVTWGDEACYICSFNVYPGGSKRKQMCLTVQGISDVKTGVHQTLSSGSSGGAEADVEVVLSCSATGKPAPTIEWLSDSIDLKEPNHRTVQNDDHTYTTNSSLTLRLPPHFEGQVGCLLNGGKRGQRHEWIPISSGDKKMEGEGNKGGISTSWITVIAVSVIICTSSIVVYVLVRRKRLQDGWTQAVKFHRAFKEDV